MEGNLGDAEFDAGYTEVLAREIREGDGQPLIFNDLAGGARNIHVQHLGPSDDEGWTAFETRVPGTDGDCYAEWDGNEGEFRSTCDDSVRFPADGRGLTSYPASVTPAGHLIVDLR